MYEVKANEKEQEIQAVTIADPREKSSDHK
jgi:hypothetical protein